MKQVPLFFAVMSRKSKDDYIAILSYLRDLLPSTNVTTVVMDFESAVWGAFKTVFPSVITRGCSFHWTQAIYRHIQDLKLVQAYQECKNTFKYLRELMCLAFLPAEEIPATFKQFRDLLQPSHPQPLHRLVQYIEDQWINSSIHPPSSWSIFGFSICTNNDPEGWHHYLNQLCARTNNQVVNLYKLIAILHKEALLVTNQCQLVASSDFITDSRVCEPDNGEISQGTRLVSAYFFH